MPDWRSDLFRLLGMDDAIIQAPMSTASTVELAVAVSKAGGLGSLAAGMLATDQIRTAIRSIRAATDRPFAVNLFAMTIEPPDSARLARVRALVADIEREVGADRFDFTPPPPPPPFAAQLAVVIEERVPVFSFTFGLPDAAQMQSLKDAGILVIGTATSAAEARQLEAAGVSAIVAQGAEAGGHRGSFASASLHAFVETLPLVRECRAAVRVPIVAGGGIMDGRDIVRAVGHGAAGVQLGTAFLCCPETALLPAWRESILAGRETVMTRTLTGKFARAIRNRIIDRMEPYEPELPEFPYIAVSTARLRAWATAHGDPEYLPLLAGQGLRRARSLPAGDLMAQLRSEIAAAGGA